jgi:hypothetical protein
MAVRWLIATIILLGMAADAAAGRAQACRRTCRDVIGTECGERLGLARPDRACRRDLLRRCKREGLGVCTYPNMVGGWRYDLASCTVTCDGEAPEPCDTTRYVSMTFLQRGTRLEETQRGLVGWFTDHAGFALEVRDVLGNTARFSGTVVSSGRVTNAAYDVDVTTAEDGICHRSELGELVR